MQKKVVKKTVKKKKKIVKKSTVEANRIKKKGSAKLRKLIGSAKTINDVEGYERVLNDELFDRDMLEIIFIRMENQTAFESQVWARPAKKILKLIAEHPLVTTEDIMRIKKMKSKPRSKYSTGTQSLYNSAHINTALANKDDLPKEKMMQMVKLAQFDIKMKALKRNDLTSDDRQSILDYSIKHHSQTPKHIKSILEEMGELKLLKTDKFRIKMIDILKKKYKFSNNWGTKPNGIKFLVVIDEYGWMDYLTDSDKKEMSDVIAAAFKRGSLPKERILKITDNLEGDTSGFLLQIYEETNDEDFLPKKVKDIFLF